MTNLIKALTGLLIVLLIGFGVYYITIRKDAKELLEPRETVTETSFQTVLEEVESSLNITLKTLSNTSKKTVIALF